MNVRQLYIKNEVKLHNARARAIPVCNLSFSCPPRINHPLPNTGLDGLVLDLFILRSQAHSHLKLSPPIRCPARHRGRHVQRYNLVPWSTSPPARTCTGSSSCQLRGSELATGDKRSVTCQRMQRTHSMMQKK